MILECPECSTRYLVPDSAIGAEGRTVRCAKCRHSWFQEPAPLPLAEQAVGEELALAPATAVSPAASGAAVSAAEPVAAPPRYDAFASQPPFRGRRSPARRHTALAVLTGLLLLALVGVILWLGKPGLGARLGLPIGSAESPLRIKDNPIERRGLENGSELFAISGRVINPSSERQRVPDIRAELRDARCRLVYSWTITPQVRSVAPGGAIDFNSAKLDVPSSSKRLELSFAGQGDTSSSSRCAG